MTEHSLQQSWKLGENGAVSPHIGNGKNGKIHDF